MITNNPGEYFKDDPNVRLITSAYEMIVDCLDYACRIVQPAFPKAERPEVYICDDEEPNATIENKTIEVNKGLLTVCSDMIDARYSDERLSRYGILGHKQGGTVRAGIRTFAWRYILMHELYHFWQGHELWEILYHFNDKGEMVENFANVRKPRKQRGERSAAVSVALTPADKELALTCQALELYADSCAVSMLINFMITDYNARRSLGQEIDKVQYLKENTTLLICALSTMFCIFDGNHGAQFGKLADNEAFYNTHPIPAIRMFHAEDVMNGMLWNHLNDEETISKVQCNWFVVDTDMEGDDGVADDWRNVFHFTAYTEKAQAHLTVLKHRMDDMHDSLSRLSMVNMPDKLDVDDMDYSPSAIYFTDQGKSLHGWR